jgi:hypothetical protein
LDEHEDVWKQKWKKQITECLSKICIKGFGKMNVPELLQAINKITNTNTGNTCIADMTTLENRYSVLVFDLHGARRRMSKACCCQKKAGKEMH